MPLSRAVILPYKPGSLSAKKLANRLTELLNLKVRRVRHEGRYRPKQRSLVINYGSNRSPNWFGRVVSSYWLNSPAHCAAAGNKLDAFRLFQSVGLSIPEWTNNRELAQGWISQGGVCVARTVLNGHSGRGIILCSGNDHPLVPAPLYVKYKKKRKEFRVHVFQGQVIDVCEKRRMRQERRPEQFDGYIRNHANGWVFCRDNIIRPVGLDALAIGACTALGLDFGAVDIIWNEKENKCYLLEVNTAPGLEKTTLETYARAIYNWIRSK